MATKTRWWWIRHAPVINPEGKLYGQLDMDVDLSDSEKFKALARLLPHKAEWMTTSLTRARETARVLSETLMSDVATIECDNFLEQSFGDWEGFSWDDITPSASKAFWKDPANNRIPNGESFAQVVKRVSLKIEGLNNQYTGKDIIAVTHTGSIRAAIAHALGGDARAGLAFQLAPLSLTRIDAIHNDESVFWRVIGVNLFGDYV